MIHHYSLWCPASRSEEVRELRTPLYGQAAAAVGLPAQSPVLAKANQQHARWLTTLTCHARTPILPDKAPKKTWNNLQPAYVPSTSSNWAGYAAETTAPTNAQATWVVPNVSSNGIDPAYSSIWPGIGGIPQVAGGAGELIQAGTEQNVSASEIPTDYFWFEIYPDENQEEITNLIPNPTDSVGALVDYSADGQAIFTICDYAQNVCGMASQTPGGAPGSSAEMVVERTTIGGQLPDLADFNSVALSDCIYDYVDSPEGGYAYPISFGGEPINMTSDGSATGTLLAKPGSLDSSGERFTDQWHNYQ